MISTNRTSRIRNSAGLLFGLLLVIIAGVSSGAPADSPLTGLPAATNIDGGDLIYLVTSPTGTPTSRKTTVTNFMSSSPVIGTLTNLLTAGSNVAIVPSGSQITVHSKTDTNVVKSFSSIDSIITTNATMAQIQAAFDLGGNVWVQRGNYTITTNLILSKSTVIHGNLARWTPGVGVTNALIDTGVRRMVGLPVYIHELELDGGQNLNYAGGSPYFVTLNNSPNLFFNPYWSNSTGIRIDSSCGGVVSECKIHGWSGSGIQIVNGFTNVAYQYPVLLTYGNDVQSNMCGIMLPGFYGETAGYYNNPNTTNAQAEYQQVQDNRFANNYMSISASAGNAQITGNIDVNSYISLYSGPGLNVAHGTYSLNTFNHSSIGSWFESNNGGVFVGNRYLAVQDIIFAGVTDIQFHNNWITIQRLWATNNCQGMFDHNFYQGDWGTDVVTNFTGSSNRVVVACNWSENRSSDGSQCSQVYSNTFSSGGGGSALTAVKTNSTSINAGTITNLNFIGVGTVAVTGSNLNGQADITLTGTGMGAFTDTLFVRTNGDNSTAVRGDPSHPWLSISNAVAASSAGDTIDVGSGVFDTGHGLTQKTGQKWRGTGWGTVLSNSVTTVAADGCIVNLASGGVLRDMWVWGTDDAQLQPPIGVYSDATIPGAAFTNAVLINVRTRADSDGVYVYHTNTCRLYAYNCLFESKWDCVALGGNASSHLEFFNCAFRSAWPSVSSAQNISRVLNLYQGEVKFINCELSASNAPTTTCGIGVFHTAGIVDLIDSYIFTGSTNGSILDIDNTTNGTVRVSGLGVNVSKTAGTISYAPATFQAAALNQNALTVRGTASQATDLISFQNSAGTVLGGIHSDGGASFYGDVQVRPLVDRVSLTASNATSATSDIMQLFQNAATKVLTVSSAGNLGVAGTIDATNTLTARGSAAVSGQLQVTNAVTARSTLAVSGATSLSNTLNAQLQTSFGTNAAPETYNTNYHSFSLPGKSVAWSLVGDTGAGSNYVNVPMFTLAQTNSGNIESATLNTTGTLKTAGNFTVGSGATSAIFSDALGVLIGQGSAFAILESPADGALLLLNNATTAFSKIQFGGTSAAFPAIYTTNSNGFELKTGTGGAYTNLTLATMTATNGVIYVQGAAPTAAQIGGTVGSKTNHWLGVVNGALMSYWSDGTTLYGPKQQAP